MANNSIVLREDEYIETDGRPFCVKCKTARAVIFDEKDFYKVVRCKCKCQMEAIEKEEEEKQKQKLLERLKEMKSNSLLAERYMNAEFDTTEIINDQHKQVIERLKKYCSGFRKNNKGLGIYLYGNNGSGKTHLTACMIEDLTNQLIPCVFTNMTEITRKLSQFFGTPRQMAYVNSLTSAKVLFIDDFGTENVKKNGEDNWTHNVIYEIINTRYNNMLPTIYTSNYSLKQCIEERGIMQKIIDRIFESTVQIKLELPSYRLRKKEDVYF